MLEINVCIGSSCHVRGSYNVIQAIQQIIEEKSLHDKINFNTTFCMKECHNAGVGVTVNGEAYNVSPNGIEPFLQTILEKILS
ncbi:MAG: (2Fe-2S) ferredoxin domain-containing protein [Synergistaceae bacterium]|nr:(2Fe-2S) ferredoxin domain-containing protein [Synergistaceae bacterium]